MESLYLPYMTLNDPLDYAFDMMYQTDNRAILLNRIDSYKIYTNDDVAEMIIAPASQNETLRTCSVLTRMRGIDVIDLTGPFDAIHELQRIDLLSTGQTIMETFFQKQFDQNRVDYGIFFPHFRKGFANLM